MRTNPSQRMGDDVNPNKDQQNTTLSGWWLLAVRAGWVAVAASVLGLVVWLLSTFLYLVVLFVFPDGRFVPRWTRVLGGPAGVRAALG